MSTQMMFELSRQDEMKRDLTLLRILAKAVREMRNAGGSPFDVVCALRSMADDVYHDASEAYWGGNLNEESSDV